MFLNFHDDVIRRLKGIKQAQELANKYSDGFDDYVANGLLERGQRFCNTEFLGLLYAYRFSPMHYAAITSILPKEAPEVLVDFGGGPGTAMLAVAEESSLKFERLSLEHAKGMRDVANSAFSWAKGRCSTNREHEFPDACFWNQGEDMTKGRRALLVFSYFFAQDLSKQFVRALASRVLSLPAASKTILYTNPVGPSAAWMPRGGIHDWYREFASALGHSPRIKTHSFTYQTVRNLREHVSRSGDCAFEIWHC